ncbi:TlpA disulfide reductase family protein [Rhodanobacter sp. DHB23]|uniref:TlpA family protein disulfide reductase n=1 Tax=Rhodanobacter sp. DHB23 TaxID=2775923 RepID=UPI00177BF17F|nr:TlpA disulfide reductase family protein [Rhodanobacter sp. DHB23]MBD8874091.1 TlpA family protein disulfide reductase [Rhodanobacter sp. DHB23]
MGMERARGWLVLLGGVLALAGFAASAQGDGKAGTALDPLLKMEGIDGSYAVAYRDVDGKVMAKADFVAAVMQKSMTFDVRRDPARRTAELRLNAADSVQAKELRAQTAAMAKTSAQGHALEPGQPLPAFRLADLDGHVVDNASLHGHVTLVNFFFATCVPCIQETPALNAYARAHPRMPVLAVTFDDVKTARDYVAAHRFGWPVLADGMDFIQAMGVDSYPQVALVGADGRLLDIRFSGSIHEGDGTITPRDLDRWVAGVLAKQPAK